MTADDARPDPGSEVVLALAGHVDHGKSALAGALTGQRTDRREAEQARGLTIDLGHLVLGDGDAQVAMTDVPGHVDYLGNALVGLSGATGALLVVAADDGWMPQTEDHVRAARWLGVPIVLAVVTKPDVVPAARVREVTEDVRRRLHGSEATPVVAASAVTGQGVDEVRTLLGRLVPPAPRGRAPRLWIDRAFHVGGRGLVVAGTLTRGLLAVGDRLAVAPTARVGRVRGLQRHGLDVDAVRGPTRVAIDLADAHAERGDRLVAAALAPAVPGSTGVDAWVGSEHGPGIGERGAWILHVGSTQVEARVSPLHGHDLTEGQSGPVHLRLARRVPLVHGDTFVLRDVGRRVVAGGGTVLDPAPPGRARGRAARDRRAATLATLQATSTPLGDLVAADGGVAPLTRVATAFADPRLDATDHADEGLATVAGHLTTSAWREGLASDVRARVEAAGPAGVSAEEVAADVAAGGVPVGVVRALIATVDGIDRRDTHLVATSQRAVLDDHRAAALAALHQGLRAAPLSPPPLADLLAETGVTRTELDRLVRRRTILVSGDYGFLPAAVRVVVGRLRELQAASGPFTVSEARDVLGVTRRHAVPWMELLDRLGATTREGDRRWLTPTGGSTQGSQGDTGR